MCKSSETQAECHTRLKCNTNEELEDCQKRLLQCKGDETLRDCEARVGAGSQSSGNGGQRGGGGGRDQNNGDRGGGDRGNRGDRGGDRGDRGGGDRDDGGSSGGRGRRRHGGGGGGGHGDFEANKTFGLGLELGEPDGLNGKYFVSRSGALDFGIGYIYDTYYFGDGFHIYGDYLWHPTSLASNPSFELPFYVGVGLRYWNFDYCYMGVCNYGGSAVGVRVPLGLSFDFNNVPLDIFLQIVPVVDFVGGNYYDRYGDRAHFGFDASVGIRLWLK